MNKHIHVPRYYLFQKLKKTQKKKKSIFNFGKHVHMCMYDPFVSTVLLNHWFFTSTYLAQLNENSDDDEEEYEQDDGESADVSTSQEEEGSGSSLPSQEHKRKVDPSSLPMGPPHPDQGEMHSMATHHNNSLDNVSVNKHTALSHYQYPYQHQYSHMPNSSSPFHSAHPPHHVSFDDDPVDVKTSNNDNNNNNNNNNNNLPKTLFPTMQPKTQSHSSQTFSEKDHSEASSTEEREHSLHHDPHSYNGGHSTTPGPLLKTKSDKTGVFRSFANQTIFFVVVVVVVVYFERKKKETDENETSKGNKKRSGSKWTLDIRKTKNKDKEKDQGKGKGKGKDKTKEKKKQKTKEAKTLPKQNTSYSIESAAKQQKQKEKEKEKEKEKHKVKQEKEKEKKKEKRKAKRNKDSGKEKKKERLWSPKSMDYRWTFATPQDQVKKVSHDNEFSNTINTNSHDPIQPNPNLNINLNANNNNNNNNNTQMLDGNKKLTPPLWSTAAHAQINSADMSDGNLLPLHAQHESVYSSSMGNLHASSHKLVKARSFSPDALMLDNAFDSAPSNPQHNTNEALLLRSKSAWPKTITSHPPRYNLPKNGSLSLAGDCGHDEMLVEIRIDHTETGYLFVGVLNSKKERVNVAKPGFMLGFNDYSWSLFGYNGTVYHNSIREPYITSRKGKEQPRPDKPKSTHTLTTTHTTIPSSEYTIGHEDANTSSGANGTMHELIEGKDELKEEPKEEMKREWTERKEEEKTSQKEDEGAISRAPNVSDDDERRHSRQPRVHSVFNRQKRVIPILKTGDIIKLRLKLNRKSEKVNVSFILNNGDCGVIWKNLEPPLNVAVTLVGRGEQVTLLSCNYQPILPQKSCIIL
ncbi:hypothetical protein RFI_30542 [Reticulomyxa filosa]|uniref:Uncharacterized protein n=1 Tax=Reticulomyxa filosa TaxID=46433 RepID=X6LZT6_RETFI|nr:hypothetical protein RFI_30542 [Reticulomyxa filosa]|eukprot:ETO06851.1 hypothetical protein RFI_30542 [Reticulomyxa filosa]